MAETRNSQLIRNAVRELEATLRPQIQAMFVEQNAKIDKQNAKINKSIADLFEALRLHTAASSENVSDKSSGAATSRKSYSGDTRLATLGFPRFNGDNVKEWLCQIEQFFTDNHTPEELKVGMASVHFDAQAATWHQSVAQLKSGDTILRNWPAYKELLRQRFGEVFDEPIAELKALQETDGIIDYHNKFELIRVRSSLPEDYLVSAYLEGLSVDTQKHVRMFQPKSIHHCLLIGRLYETAHPKKTSYNNWQIIQSTSSASQAKILLPLSKEIEPGKDQKSTSKEIVTPRKILTAEQMNERRAQRFSYCRDKNDDLDDTEPDTTLIEREPQISTNIMKVGFEGNKLLEPVETLTASWTMVSEFNASKTQLTRIPESIGRLSNLVRLDLHQNRISTLPASIKGCSSIIELYIRSNCLSALPPELGDSSHLGTHDLHSNQLKEYPVEMCKLKLTVLDLSYNSFSDLSAAMGLMNTLRRPVLLGNHMRTMRNTLWVKGIHSKRLKVHINHLHQLLSYMGVLL